MKKRKSEGEDKTGASKEIIYISKGWAEAPGEKLIKPWNTFAKKSDLVYACTVKSKHKVEDCVIPLHKFVRKQLC